MRHRAEKYSDKLDKRNHGRSMKINTKNGSPFNQGYTALLEKFSDLIQVM